jgi:hypothetical protein
MPPLYNAYEAKILNVLHSKLCKEDKRKMISLSWANCPFSKKNSLFSGATSPHTHTGLFSRATCPHILKVVFFQGRLAHTLKIVYFHGRPAHTYSKWSIFTDDLPTHTQSGLFSRATGPRTLTHNGLFSRATCPHTLTVVYFQGRPAHTYSKWSIFTGDLPTHSHWSIFTGDLPTHTHFGLFSRATDPFDWVYLRSHLAI